MKSSVEGKVYLNRLPRKRFNMCVAEANRSLCYDFNV